MQFVSPLHVTSKVDWYHDYQPATARLPANPQLTVSSKSPIKRIAIIQLQNWFHMSLARNPIAIIYEPRERFPSYSNVYPCISRLFKSAKKHIGDSCPPGLHGALPFGCKTFISGIYIVVVNTLESSTGKKLQRRCPL